MKNTEFNEISDNSVALSDEDDPLVLAELKNKIPLTRPEVMALASQLIRITHTRAVRTRFKPSSKDNTRLSFARACSGLIETYSKLLKEAEVQELAERVEALEKGRVKVREVILE